tara:strand:- start:307 stop:681 length:375 start_codon:yes stop_codon:yes gene_type:complete
MDAVILASGAGSRMGVKFKKKPKCLIDILKDLTILDLLIEQLQDMKTIYIVVGFHKSKIINHIKKRYNSKNFFFIDNRFYKSKGNYYSALLTKKFLKNSFILLDADIILPKNSIKKLISINKKT